MTYINRDTLLEIIADKNRNTCNGSMTCLQIKRMVEKLPTADVAPKSEVAREIEAFEQKVGQIYNHYVFEDTDYADDDVAIEAIINALTEVLNELAELKKKYTEEGENQK